MNLDRDWDLDLDSDLSIPRLGDSAIVGEDLDKDWDLDFGIRHLSDSTDRLESVEHLRVINDSEHIGVVLRDLKNNECLETSFFSRCRCGAVSGSDFWIWSVIFFWICIWVG